MIHHMYLGAVFDQLLALAFVCPEALRLPLKEAQGANRAVGQERGPEDKKSNDSKAILSGTRGIHPGH